jgi:hypothetical protein
MKQITKEDYVRGTAYAFCEAHREIDQYLWQLFLS